MTRNLLPRLVALSTVAILALAGCSGDGADDPGNDAEEADAPADKPTSAEEAMTGDAGWVELHDMELPDPGTATLELGGESFTIDIECRGPGTDAESATSDIYLFRIAVFSEFVTPDGQTANLQIKRHVREFDGWSATGGNGDVYDYPGQDSAEITLQVVDGDRAHTGIRIAPSDDDTTGEALPLVHVSPEGGFTVQSELGGILTDDAPIHGPVTVAGQCPAPWAEL